MLLRTKKKKKQQHRNTSCVPWQGFLWSQSPELTAITEKALQCSRTHFGADNAQSIVDSSSNNQMKTRLKEAAQLSTSNDLF